ncbi:MDR family MFS transporter [Carnobacterium gallinarum]|uniref:MDR family MFS transporter n=1 Tax=Carnobacterium gallinarum TaxID=2749 RepID=UPI000B0AB5CA|nr:MFS transporter [Carnobacterium gallinarum]
MSRKTKLPRDLWIVAIGMVLLYTGLSFIWPFNMLYMTKNLGMSVTDAGTVLLVNSGIGIIGSVIGGIIFDRVSGYVSLAIGTVILIITTGSLFLFHGHPAFIYNIWAISIAMGMVFAGLYTAAGLTHPDGGRTGFNTIYVAQNIGVAVGPFLAGILAKDGLGNVYTGSFVFALIYGLFFFIYFRKIDWYSDRVEVETKHQQKGKAREKATKLGLISFGLLLLVYLFCQLPHVQWQSNLSVYMTAEKGVTVAEYGNLWSINGALILVGQVVIIPVVSRFKEKLSWQIYIGIGLFFCSFLFAMQATNYAGFLLGMILLTLGEMFAWPAIPTIAYDLAPMGQAGLYQGLVNGIATAARMLAPFLGALVVTSFGGMASLFICVFILLALAIVLLIMQQKTQKLIGKE